MAESIMESAVEEPEISPVAAEPWMPQSEEVAWLVSLEEMPMPFVMSVVGFLGMHVFLQIVFRAALPGGTGDDKEIRLPNRVLMLVHGVVSVGCGIAWLLAGPRTDRMFSYNPLAETAKDISAGFYLYNVMYLAGHVKLIGMKISVSLFLCQGLALICWTINRTFPVSFNMWLLATGSLTNLPVVFSSVSYIMQKHRSPMYLRVWNALANLLSHVLAFAVNAYVIYVAFSYIRENEMWDLQDLDERVSRFSTPFILATSGCLLASAYANLAIFQHSLNSIKAKFITPRAPPPETKKAAKTAPPSTKDGPRKRSGRLAAKTK